jgi:hypothetical protein
MKLKINPFTKSRTEYTGEEWCVLKKKEDEEAKYFKQEISLEIFKIKRNRNVCMNAIEGLFISKHYGGLWSLV